MRSICSELVKWRDSDWALLALPPLTCTTEAINGGVKMIFRNQQWANGALDITLQDRPTLLMPEGKELVWTSMGSRREGHEDVLFRLILEEARKGGLSRSAELVMPWLYPPSAECARAAVMVSRSRAAADEAAVENQRLRDELQQMRQRS